MNKKDKYGCIFLLIFFGLVFLSLKFDWELPDLPAYIYGPVVMVSIWILFMRFIDRLK